MSLYGWVCDVVELAQRGLRLATTVGVRNVTAFDGTAPMTVLPGTEPVPVPGKPVRARHDTASVSMASTLTFSVVVVVMMVVVLLVVVVMQSQQQPAQHTQKPVAGDDEDDESDKLMATTASAPLASDGIQRVPGMNATEAEMLYHALDLSSRRRRITQIYLLNACIRNAKARPSSCSSGGGSRW